MTNGVCIVRTENWPSVWCLFMILIRSGQPGLMVGGHVKNDTSSWLAIASQSEGWRFSSQALSVLSVLIYVRAPSVSVRVFVPISNLGWLAQSCIDSWLNLHLAFRFFWYDDNQSFFFLEITFLMLIQHQYLWCLQCNPDCLKNVYCQMFQHTAALRRPLTFVFCATKLNCLSVYTSCIVSCCIIVLCVRKYSEAAFQSNYQYFFCWCWGGSNRSWNKTAFACMLDRNETHLLAALLTEATWSSCCRYAHSQVLT